MVVMNVSGQKLSEIFRQSVAESDYSPMGEVDYAKMGEWVNRVQLKAEGEWFSAIASVEKLLACQLGDSERGLMLCAPTQLLVHSQVIEKLRIGIFTPKVWKQLKWLGFQLPSAEKISEDFSNDEIVELPLFPHDELNNEKFCLLYTSSFSLLMVLGEDDWGLPAFHFSFDPEIVARGWQILRERLVVAKHPQLSVIEKLIQNWGDIVPDYKVVTHFSQHLLKNLPSLPLVETKKAKVTIEEKPEETVDENPGIDLELLKALTHEIRTPLTTIRTITRLLLKRMKLGADANKYLETIDLECTEQIDRMELIFRAAELGIKPAGNRPIQLVPIALEGMLSDSVPRWQKRAKRRGVDLDVILPKKLPHVISDPCMLDQMLTGVIEKCTRSVPDGGRIRLQVSTAGNQLKLQFHSQSADERGGLRALGQILMFQPETGSLSLNMSVTKNLFQVLGGKFIVRQKPKEGEILTIFLPLGRSK
ncbi:MAG: Adaptive-response sensory-kinase SasA [Chroococcopsis gigantea SAG 12.99]|jgi:signal transduction histidine kinase|nr:HAMP domain-containing histidine kinase [Chlorogloea purpurea SAG 13.99]MDV3000576.1 Adaptive-response sensory-kinase SasA [Chroococcopsis gigantea SAG 12.99]